MQTQQVKWFSQLIKVHLVKTHTIIMHHTAVQFTNESRTFSLFIASPLTLLPTTHTHLKCFCGKKLCCQWAQHWSLSPWRLFFFSCSRGFDLLKDFDERYFPNLTHFHVFSILMKKSKTVKIWQTVWRNKDKLCSIWSLNTMRLRVCDSAVF